MAARAALKELDIGPIIGDPTAPASLKSRMVKKLEPLMHSKLGFKHLSGMRRWVRLLCCGRIYVRKNRVSIGCGKCALTTLPDRT